MRDVGLGELERRGLAFTYREVEGVSHEEALRAYADADLVVLEADPAADAANFARVRCTIRAGKLTHPVGTR